MRTYSHAILTYAAMRLANNPSRKESFAAALGATLPDIPMALGAAWLGTKGQALSSSSFDNEVCGRSLFREPDAALHSAPVMVSALALEHVLRGKNSALLLGWAGHVFADFLTHGEDSRPILWPLSEWRFRSPVSYREEGRHGKLFTIIEHAAVAAVLILAMARRNTRKR